VSEGDDPVAERRAEAASLCVRDLVENYIARHAAAQRSGKEIARRLRKNVADVIGDIKLARLHRRDLTRCIDKVKDRGAAIEANRVFEDLRATIRWARARGDLDENLMDGMRRPSESVEGDREFTDDEIRTFLTRLPDVGMDDGTRRILKLCLVTSARVGEVAGMRTAEIDFAQLVWTIPAARTKNKHVHVLPISAFAVEIINEQLAHVRQLAANRGQRLARRLARVRKAEHAMPAAPEPPELVFPGVGSRKPVTVHALSKAVKRAGADFGIAPFTPRDLRRTAATGMETLGISPFIVAHVLDHVSVTKGSVAKKHYAHYQYRKEQRDAVKKWEARLRGLISGADTAAVLPLFDRERA
jgi:integrase